MSDIFISYAREDRAQAERLARALESRSWSVWWDKSIPTGKTFDQVIEEAIDEARCVIVLWSERSTASRWVRNEAEEGAKREILVPIRIEDVEIPLAFRSIQTADLIGSGGDAGSPEIEALLGDIAALVDPSSAGEEAGRLADLPPSGHAEQRAGRRVTAGAARKHGAARSRLHGYAFMAIAAAVVALGLSALLDRLEASHLGYRLSRGQVVIRIFPGGAAEKAGMETGDVVRQIDGTPAKDWDWSEPRAIGETVTFAVERAGRALEFPLTYEDLPTVLAVESVLFFVAGLFILWVCLWAYNETLSTTSKVLALFGLSFSIAFLGLPSQQPLMGKLLNVLVLLSLAFLVHFLMIYPKRRGLVDKFGWAQAHYSPVVVWAIVYFPREDSDRVLDLVILFSWIFYFAAAFLLVTLSFMSATKTERSEQGLRLMLVGVTLGLLPSTIALFLHTFYPTVVPRGVGFYDLALALIPITCAIAAVRGYKATVAASRR